MDQRGSFRRRRYLLIDVQAGWAKNELFIQNRRKRPYPSTGHRDRCALQPQFAGDFLFVQTDWKAPRKRIIKIDLRDPKPEKWQEVVPTAEDAIQEYSAMGGKLFVNYLHNVTSRIAIFSLDGKPSGRGGTAFLRFGVNLWALGQDEGIL